MAPRPQVASATNLAAKYPESSTRSISGRVDRISLEPGCELTPSAIKMSLMPFSRKQSRDSRRKMLELQELAGCSGRFPQLVADSRVMFSDCLGVLVGFSEASTGVYHRAHE